MDLATGRLPNDNLWQTILELNAFGPRFEGISYPDTYKMDKTSMYLKCILAKPGVMDICCEYLDGKFGSSKGAAMNEESYVETFCQQMLSDYYLESDDLQQCSVLSLQRIFNTLHAKGCFAEVFIMVLQHQLQSVVVKDHLRDDKNGSSLDYHTLPIFRDILNARRGAKDALENVTKACATLWIHFGMPFLFGSHCHSSSHSSNDIQREILHLAELLGIGVSYFAWLYGKEMNEDPYALAEIMGLLFERELEKATLSSQEEYDEWMYDSIKLRFISTIQKEIIPQLRPRLAERLHVVGLYNSLYGG
jgi:hypothetical protein